MQVINLKKSFNGKEVVKNVSFEIKKGQVTSFIGANGAGKSTVLNMLTRLIKRDAGHILLDDKDILSYKDRDLAKRISILTQSSNIISKLSIRDLVSFGRYPHSQGRLTDEDIFYVEKSLSFMDLKNIEDKYLDEVSGGQRQRALIAMTLCQDTDYIFLDEPTNNLDIHHSRNLMQNIRLLCDEFNKTVVMVLHEINLASFYSDRICAFKDGALYKEGSTASVLTKDTLHDLYQVDFSSVSIKGKELFVNF